MDILSIICWKDPLAAKMTKVVLNAVRNKIIHRVSACIRDNRNGVARRYDKNYVQALAQSVEIGAGQTVARDLQFVFKNTSPEAREYLEGNIGTYAWPNGGLKPWHTKLNIRLTQDILLYKRHGLTFNMDIFDFLNLLDPSWGRAHNIINEELYNVERCNPEKCSSQKI